MADENDIRIEIETELKGIDKVKKQFADLLKDSKAVAEKTEKAFKDIQLIPDSRKQKQELKNLFKEVDNQLKQAKRRMIELNKESLSLTGKEKSALRPFKLDQKLAENDLKMVRDQAKQFEKVIDNLNREVAKASNQRQKQLEKDWRGAAKWVEENIKSKQKEVDSVLKAEQKFLADLEKGAQAEIKIEQKKLEELTRLRKLGESAMDEFDTKNQLADLSPQTKAILPKMGNVGDGKGLQSLFANFTKGVGSLVVGLGIFTSIQEAISRTIDFYKEATTAAIDFAQAQFTLSVQVEAAQKVLGTTEAGTLTDWKKRIQELRKELVIYSETDVTKAVSQTSVLTRVLGLNADQQEQVIRIAATLAQTTGVDLSQAVDDVTKALGGSSVVLDKYGLFIRDADKGAAAFQLGFTEKVLKGTQTLNSQQLALATLKTVMDQVNPLFESLGGYEDTLPGRLKVADAAIADHTKNIGGLFTETNLLFKNLFANFLAYVEDVSKNFQPLLDFIKIINKELEENRDITKEIGSNPDFKDFNLIPTLKGTKNAQKRGEEAGVGFSIFSEEDLAGSKENIKAFLLAQTQYLNQRKALILRNQREMAEQSLSEQRKGEQITGGVRGSGPPDLDGEDEEVEERAKKLEDLTKEYGLRIVDAYKEYKGNLFKAQQERIKELDKANKDEISAINKQKDKLKKAFADLALEIFRKREDLDRDHARDLENIDSDANAKRLQIEEEFQNTSEENTEDYYDRLRELEDQYYFDLRDAVAENDAVAIKRLERKFNLDKNKLENSLADQEQDEQQSFQRKLDELEQDTVDRKAELDRRYQRELEDLDLFEERKRQDIAASHDEEMDEIQTHYDEMRQEIEMAYEDQRFSIEVAYQDRLLSLANALSEEEFVTQRFLQDLFNQYDQYIGSQGMITQMIMEFHNRLGEMAGIGPEIDMGSQIDAMNAGLFNELTNRNREAENQLMTLVIDLENELLNAHVDTRMGDIIQDVVIRRPGQPSRM